MNVDQGFWKLLLLGVGGLVILKVKL
jgi:hypothetical protein